ncbi:histidine phosphatase family protein [Candidatus Leptofilum sp.]|uniref:histidine phosphatase family protein n=1 Tax=Candidatus Leptofilum sp. TaxID=3241576 RepID=UPI003B5C82B8
MPPKLILVRHAAVQVNPSVNSHQWQLTPDGRSTTHTLAQKLKPCQPHRIFTSEEPKAIATGAALAEKLLLPTQAIPGLQEHDRRGVPYFERKADFETAVSRLFAHPDELVFGNETAVQAVTRFTQAVNQQLAVYPQDNVAIVSHGTVLTLYICQYNQQLTPQLFWQALTLPSAFILSLPNKQLVQSLYLKR